MLMIDTTRRHIEVSTILAKKILGEIPLEMYTVPFSRWPTGSVSAPSVWSESEEGCRPDNDAHGEHGQK